MSPLPVALLFATAERSTPRMVGRRDGRARLRRGWRRDGAGREAGDGALQGGGVLVAAPARGFAIRARMAPWLEDEGLRRRGLRHEQRALVEHEQAPIEEFTDLHAAARVRAAPRPWGDLRPAARQGHGVVARHGARVAAAEDAVEVARRGTPRRRGMSRRLTETPLEVLDERGQEGVGRLQGI